MAGLTQSQQQAALDFIFPTSDATDHIAYSANGASESGVMARTAIGATGWAAATAATPSVKANANALTSATATAGATLTHYALYSASSDGIQKTDWKTLDNQRVLVIGDQVTWAIGACVVTLD